MSDKNPIYIDYYSHEKCDCYKIDLPWTKYAQDTRVLCPVSMGLEYAKLIAVGVIVQHLTLALQAEVKNHGKED